MKPIRTILFDLDGTLIDTELAAAKAIRDCFREWRIAVTPEDSNYITGRTWASAFAFLFAKYTIPVPAAEASRRMMECYRAELRRELPLVPGGVDAVRALAAEGDLALGLVSGSNRAEILWALERLAIVEHFRVVLGAEDYPRSKPAPDGYLKALAALGGEAASALVFEDSAPGIDSALSAGAWVVAITGTNHHGQDTSKAHAHIPDLRGVTRKWVREFAPARTKRGSKPTGG